MKSEDFEEGKTIHQKVGRLYRELCRGARKARDECGYFKKIKKKKELSLLKREHLAKAKAKSEVLMSLITQLEDVFGMRQKDGRKYIEHITKTKLNKGEA